MQTRTQLEIEALRMTCAVQGHKLARICNVIEEERSAPIDLTPCRSVHVVEIIRRILVEK